MTACSVIGRFELRFLRTEKRPWIVWDVHREVAVFSLSPIDKTHAEQIVENLNGVPIAEAA